MCLLSRHQGAAATVQLITELLLTNTLQLAHHEDGSCFLMNPDARYFTRIRASELLNANDAETIALPLRIACHEVASKTARQWAEYPELADKHFRELTVILDEEEPDYKD